MNSVSPTLKIIGSVLVLLAVIVLGVLAVQKKAFFKTSGPPTAIGGPTAAELSEKKKTEAQQKQAYNDSAKDSAISTPSIPTPSESSLSLSAKQEGDSVTVQVKAPGVSSGTCTLNVVNSNKTLSRNAPIIYQPEFSTCAGFSLPASSIGPGDWRVKVTVAAQDGIVVSQATNLRVE